jgi:hypothetical protein
MTDAPTDAAPTVPVAASAASHFSLATLRHVSSKPCGVGAGMAVCAPLGVVVVSHFDDTLSVLRSAPPFELLATFGAHGDGPLQFSMACGWLWREVLGGGAWEGGIAFTAGTPPTLLVAEAGNGRVQEVAVDAAGAATHIGLRYAGQVTAPVAVAACADLVAVSENMRAIATLHRVSLFAAGTGALVCRVGDALLGAFGREGALHGNRGVCFSTDGATLAVVDQAGISGGRLSLFATADGRCVGSAPVGKWAHGVARVPGGWVTVSGVDSLLLPAASVDSVADGEARAGASLGSHGDGPGRFKEPTAVAFLPGVGLLVRDRARLELYA